MPDRSPAHTGVLLVNLGTPDTPSPAGVRDFLREMLSDPRIVELPRAVWWPILHGIVLRVRPRRSAEAYRKIWTAEGSPQLAIGRRLLQSLRATLEGKGYAIELGMNYRRPSIPDSLDALFAAGAQRIVVLPLFPQYSGATTGAVFDRVSSHLRGRRRVPELGFLSEYHARPGYIEALRNSVIEHWRTHPRPQHLLMSFHGLPKRNCDDGDPYRVQCERTAQLLAAALELGKAEWSLSFQSRFGAQEWLRPYTDEQLKSLPRAGVKRLAVICPGFATDCLETLEEVAIRGAETFQKQGGESLDYIPALNDRRDHAEFLADLIHSVFPGDAK